MRRAKGVLIQPYYLNDRFGLPENRVFLVNISEFFVTCSKIALTIINTDFTTIIIPYTLFDEWWLMFCIFQATVAHSVS